MAKVVSAVDKVRALIAEKHELTSEGDDWMEPYRRIRTEIAALKSVVDLETFDEIRALELADHGLNEAGLDYSNQRCYCGHRRGAHSLRGCHVGNEKWNTRNKRNDPRCDCRGFIEKSEYERAVAEEAEEHERRRAEAEHWCDNCDDAVDEPTTKYDCGNCGSEFTYEDEGTNRCPDCGKFAAKMDGAYCPDCGEETRDLSEEGD